jgi:hypothetical protein
MIGSWPMSPQPTARETREIIFRLGHELAARGAHVRHDVIGGFRFRMPLLHRGASAGPLSAILSGRVTIGAGLGEPWRVRYDLRFTLLTIIALALSIGLVGVGFHWPRMRLLDVLGLVWVVAYGIPCARAMRTFRKLVTEAARGGRTDGGRPDG